MPLVVITEKAIKTLTLPSNGGKMEVEEVLQLSGKAVKTRISEKSWKDSKQLILTQDQDNFCIWSLSNQLQLNKLL